jgi:probable addiction module antidote protein
MKRKFPVAVPFEVDLYKHLRDPHNAAEYLNACLELAIEENDPRGVLLGLYDVAQARGMKKTAEAAKMHRVTLHRMLNKKGNPEWNSLFRLLQATQLRFRFESTIKKAA